MGWPVSKCLYRVGAPALAMFFGFTLVDIFKRKASVGEALVSNSALFGLLWIAVAAFFWLLSRMMPKTP